MFLCQASAATVSPVNGSCTFPSSPYGVESVAAGNQTFKVYNRVYNTPINKS